MTHAATLARGLRNNNPGNVRLTSPATDWAGWIGAQAQTDPDYVQMLSMTAGVRMALIVFRNYQRRYGLTSVRAMVSRWAPGVENDTTSYIADVAARVGVDADAPIDLHDRDTAWSFLRAIFRHECGPEAESIPAATIDAGIEAAT